jgi:two-component system, NarL family, invasion response regulator UvrY
MIFLSESKRLLFNRIDGAMKVFLADDHPLMVEGLKLRINEYGIDVVDTVYSLDDLPEKFCASQADVLVIDFGFKGSDGQTGLDICEKILSANKNTKIVMFSQFDDAWIIEKTYKMGVLAFVRKDERTEVIVDAIHSVYEGKEFFSPIVAVLLARNSVKSPSPRQLLDAKELQVFKLIADGLSVTEAAESLGLSYKTVANSVKNIKQKLNVSTFADFTKLAIVYGLTTMDIKRPSANDSIHEKS